MLIFRNNIKPRDWGKCVLLHSEVLGMVAEEAALKTEGKQKPSPELGGAESWGQPELRKSSSAQV